MRILKIATILTACFSLAACGTMPTTATTRVDNPPQIVIENAPAGSTVLVDGSAIGSTGERDRDNKFQTKAGRHTVTVEYMGNEILSQEIFVQDGTTRVLTAN